MRSKTTITLSPRQRLGRGLKYSMIGPVEVTRGAVGVGVESARSSAAWIGDRYRRSQLGKQLKAELSAAQQTLAAELAVAQEMVSDLPDTLGKARKTRSRRNVVLAAGIGTVVLAGGAAAFVILRRSTQPEPSTLEPSVEVAPRP